MNILLSLKEGSNRAIFEGFFANTPAIVLKSNIGVNKSYINEQTGRLIREDELPEALVEFRSSFSRYSPRKVGDAEHIPRTEHGETGKDHHGAVGTR